MTDIQIGGKSYTADELKVLEKAGMLQIGTKNDAGSSTPTSNPLHGPWAQNENIFGIFSDGTVRPQRYSAMLRPKSLLSVLPLMKSSIYDSKREIMTGQTAASGTNATAFCDTAPTYGKLKTCQQLINFGKYMGATKVNSLAQTGMLRDYADVQAQIMNNASPSPFLPDIMGRLVDTRSQLMNELFTFGVGMERATAKVAINGTQGTKNDTYIGWFEQFDGLDQKVKTGHTDAVTGVACAAADSIVDTYAANISGAGADGRQLVETLTEHWYALNDIADGVGMSGTQFAFVMRPETFHAVVEVWACTYATYACAGTATSPNNRDGMQIQTLRVGMENGRYLLVNGVQVPVVLDTGIALEITDFTNKVYTSDIFLVPLNWGGNPLLYAEYFPMDNTYAQELARFASPDGTYEYINNGLFVVTSGTTNFCKDIVFASQMRLVLETPFLASRLDDVSFTYLAKTRAADPGTTAFYANGGVSGRL